MNLNIGSIKEIIKKGLLRVLSASILNKVFALIANIVIVRILEKVEYGYYGWAYNIITVFLLFSGLGINNGVLQYCSEDISESKRRKYYKFGFLYGIAINFIISLVALFYSIFCPVSIEEGRWVLQALVFLPIFYFIYNYSLAYLRSRLQNKKYANMTNIHSFSHLVLLIGGACLWGLPGYIVGYYAAFIVSTIYLIVVSREDLRHIFDSQHTGLKENISLIKYSFVCVVNNGISHLLYILDVFLIGVIIADAEVIASYKASTTIPTSLYFITSSVMLVVYPYFAKHKDDLSWVRNKSKLVISGLFAINIPIAIFLFFGAPLIVNILYSAKYTDAVPVFRVLAIGYGITTTIKIPCGNMLSMMRRIKANLIIDIICGITNVIGDVILIQKYGSIGAAYATVIVIIVGSICSGWYYYKVTHTAS